MLESAYLTPSGYEKTADLMVYGFKEVAGIYPNHNLPDNHGGWLLKNKKTPQIPSFASIEDESYK